MKRQNGLVKLRRRTTKDGGASLYLEIAENGNRTYEFLRLYLVPERTRIDRIRNAETLRTAEAAKAQRIIELQNTAHGFSNSRTRGKTGFVRYITEKAKEGGVSTNGTYYELIYHLNAYSPQIASFYGVLYNTCGRCGTDRQAAGLRPIPFGLFATS